MITKDESEKIYTRHGCVCKKEYQAKPHGKIIRNNCVSGYGFGKSTKDSWCRTQDKCGMEELEYPELGKSWDRCHVSPNRSFLDDKINYGKKYFVLNLLGIILFYIIFVLFIPFLLYRYKYDEILEVYMPNFDLMATSFSFMAGMSLPGQWRLNELYTMDPKNWMGFTSTLLINFMSLLAMLFLTTRMAKRTNSIPIGFAAGGVMLFMTYLLPNELIAAVQEKVFTTIKKYFLKNEKKQPFIKNGRLCKDNLDCSFPLWLFVVFVGFVMSCIFILIEKTIVMNTKFMILPLAKKIKKMAHAMRLGHLL